MALFNSSGIATVTLSTSAIQGYGAHDAAVSGNPFLMALEAKDFDGSWVYGSKKPRRSKRGYVAQGSFIPGIGFRK